MNLRYALLAFVAAVGGPPSVRAADYPAPAHGYGAVPPAFGQSEWLCPSCAAAATGRCKACGHALAHGHKNKGPYVTALCPGACFGYFQTQWRKWDEVCPLPYQGVGISDAPKPPSPHLPSIYDRLPPDKKGSTLPTPRPVDPQPGMPSSPQGGSDALPPIPMPPGEGSAVRPVGGTDWRPVRQ